jgi:hypothetical protein
MPCICFTNLCVAGWKKSVYPNIRKLADEEGASIFFEDEASAQPL